MKYLCLVYIDPKKVSRLSGPEFDALSEEAQAYSEELQTSGSFIFSSRLQDVTSAAIVHAGNGDVSVTDGPFAETKEHLGGFVLIEARDMNDAIRFASKFPQARLGYIEVRPVERFNAC